MKRYLVAADADQIQNLLFRSSHLREVVGGSMLLSEFCRTDAVTAFNQFGKNADVNIIINDGGSFRMEFDSEDKAKDFLEFLADSFREETGGTLTSAGPIEYQNSDFQAKNQELQLQLLEAKYCRAGAEAEPHLPITAFCTSCGIGLASHYAKPASEIREEVETYLCLYCHDKANKNFLGRPFFYEDYRDAMKKKYPEKFSSLSGYLENPMDPAELIGSLDATQYVGYVLADVNGMGSHFNRCESKEALSELSEALTDALWSSLAEPIPDLIDRLKEREQLCKLKKRMPIVPLILGGDDLLALVPARYALDLGRRIGEAFENDEKMKKLDVTIGVAVIICQKHYPYTLAYERGHELLAQAKKLGKSLKDQKLSAINFEVIVGNELKASTDNQAKNGKKVRSTLKPYWIGSKEEAATANATRAGIHFETLLDQRLNLKKIPNKRLHELRRFFDPEGMKSEERKKWTADFTDFRKRVESEEWATDLDKVLEALGVDEKSNWYSFSRRPKEDPYSAHGILDLIEAWDYAYKVGESDEEYRVEES